MHHVWGDKDFDWESLREAEHDIHRVCYRLGRLCVSTKEKWGTLRVTVYWWGGDIRALFYPCRYGRFCSWTRWIGLQWLVHKWQRWVYRYAYARIVKKYPHIRDELLVDADYPEMIEGGMEVYNRHWVSCDNRDDIP
jgi:hypothetical protein